MRFLFIWWASVAAVRLPWTLGPILAFDEQDPLSARHRHHVFDEQRFGHLSCLRLPNWLRALRAFATASTHGCPGAPDLPRQRFVRTTDRAPSVAPLALARVASLTVGSRAPFSYMNGLCGRARMPAPHFVPARLIAALAIAPCLGHWQSGPSRARWGLTLRSTGRAGTCFDLWSPSARRAGYLAR